MFDKVLSWFMYGWTALALALEASDITRLIATAPSWGSGLQAGAAQMVRCIQPSRARPDVAGHRRVHLAGETSPTGAATSQAINRARRIATPAPPRRASRAWWRQNAQRLARRRRPLPRLRRKARRHFCHQGRASGRTADGEGKNTQPFAGHREHGVGDGGANWRDAGFADAGRGLG